MSDSWEMGALAAQDRYEPFVPSRRAGMTPWKAMDIRAAQADEPRDPTLLDPATNQFLGELALPSSPLDFGMMAMGPAGRVAGAAGKIGAAAAGIYGELVNEAEAGKAKTVKQAMGNILSPASKTFTDEGLPIAGGGYTKRAREVLDEIAAGQKGAGPMDMSMSAMTPGVPQVAMDRLVPPRGVSPRLQDALQNQEMMKGVRESIDRGISLGADKWYHNEPVRQAFLKELGKEEGPKAYTQFMDHVAATSPRSDVPTNIRNASFQYQHARKGQDLPDKLPYPYGHVAQNLHRQNFDMLTAPQPGSLSSAAAPHDFGRWDIYQNPKPASFSQNLQGNLEPGTMDTHAFRNIGMRTGDPRFMETSVSAKYKSGSDPGKDTIVAKYGEWTKPDTVAFRPQRLHKEGRLSLEEAQKIPYFWAAKPNPNEYGAAEQLYKRLGQERGLPTADAQAAAWAGGGDVTGLGTSAVHTFPEMMNERILFTAKMRGEDPQKTLSDFIRGNRPLLSIGGAAGGMGAVAAQNRYGEGM